MIPRPTMMIEPFSYTHDDVEWSADLYEGSLYEVDTWAALLREHYPRDTGWDTHVVTWYRSESRATCRTRRLVPTDVWDALLEWLTEATLELGEELDPVSPDPVSPGALIGRRVRRRREARGWTQRQLADAARLCRPNISRLESGTAHCPRLDVLCRVAEALQTTLMDLVAPIDAVRMGLPEDELEVEIDAERQA